MTAAPILFPRLVAASEGEWRAYIRHRFVLLLASGELPEACFRRYLVQDYLFLIHFARAWGLAIYKSDELGEMRRAQRLVGDAPFAQFLGDSHPQHYGTAGHLRLVRRDVPYALQY